MAVRRSRAFGIFAGGRVCWAGALLVLAALAGGAWSLHGWRCWRPAACLAHGRARLLGSLALVLALFIGWRLRPAPGRYAPPPVSLPRQAHTAHAATAGPGSGEGLPIMPPRPGSAIAGRPAENGHGPPPRVFTAPGLVSW